MPKIKVVEIKDEMVEIDAFKTMILFCNNSCKNVRLTGDSALPVLYIGIAFFLPLFMLPKKYSQHITNRSLKRDFFLKNGTFMSELSCCK